MNKRCMIFIFALLLAASATQAGLWNPPVLNESFESPVLNVGQWSPKNAARAPDPVPISATAQIP